MTKYVLMGLVVAACLAVGTNDARAHCGKCGVGESKDAAEVKALCEKCGQVKGSDVCCKEGAEVCQTCKLHKDSPGCVKNCAAKHSEDHGHKHAEGDGHDHAPKEGEKAH